MSAFNSFPVRRRSRRFSSYRSDDRDGLACCDTMPPNHRAHRRGFLILLMIAGVLAAVAAIGGTVNGLSDMFGAFPSGAALLEVAAWDKFFAGIGRLATLVLLCAAVVLVVRWRMRRVKRSKAK